MALTSSHRFGLDWRNNELTEVSAYGTERSGWSAGDRQSQRNSIHTAQFTERSNISKRLCWLRSCRAVTWRVVNQPGIDDIDGTCSAVVAQRALVAADEATAFAAARARDNATNSLGCRGVKADKVERGIARDCVTAYAGSTRTACGRPAMAESSCTLAAPRLSLTSFALFSCTPRLPGLGIVDKKKRWESRQIHQLPTDSHDGHDIQDLHSPDMWPKSYEAKLE